MLGRGVPAVPALAARVLAASALAGGMLAGGLLTLSAPALAAGISAQASSPASSVGSLSISLTAPTAITSFTAHILTASSTDVLDLPEADFTLTTPTTAAGTTTWTLTSAITTSQLLLGSYLVTVDAADSGGDTATGLDAGNLNYLIQPTVTLSATPAGLGYGAPTTTLAGSVTGLMPDGSTVPLGHQQVLLTSAGAGSQATQTDAAGSFALSESSAGTFIAIVEGSTIAPASSPPVIVTATTTPTQLTASVSTTRATFGQQVTVTGSLSYEPAATWEPLAAVSVVVQAPGYPAMSVPVTDSGGNFTGSFTATESGPVVVYFNTVQHPQGGSYPFLAPAQYSTAGIVVSLPTHLTRFAAKVASSGAVTARGCLGVAGISPAAAFSVQGTITIQYAAGKSGPWHKLGVIAKTSPHAGTTCGVATAEASFTGTFAARLARAYYRASFRPAAGVTWLPSVSSPALAWKYRTEIKSLSVSPTRLAKGARITISGQLLQDKSRWVPFGRQTVEIIFRKPKTATRHRVVTVRTSASGRFTVTVKDTRTAIWSASYPGNPTHFSTTPRGVRVTAT